MLRVGVDVGGTFTDLVVHDDATRRLEVLKTPSTPHAARYPSLAKAHKENCAARPAAQSPALGRPAVVQGAAATNARCKVFSAAWRPIAWPASMSKR